MSHTVCQPPTARLPCQLSGFYANGSCSDFVAEDACSQTAIVNPCENGGTFYHQKRTCHCVEGFVGDYCHRRYRDCRETPGEFELYTIQPFGSDYFFEWKCYQEIYFVTRYQHYFNFNHTKGWQMMRQGIPFQNGLYFMGLEPLHQLTKQGTYDMCVALSIYYPGYRHTGYLWYRNVRVDFEADGYALHWDYFEKEQSYNSSIYLDGFGGLGDATKNLNGARFGTYDRDVSGCARAQSRGWWYNELGCTTLEFVHNGVMWPTNRTGTIKLEFVNYFYLRIQSVAYYREDDLVL